MREYSEQGIKGCVQRRKNRQTETIISVFQGMQAGLAQDPAKGIWVTVCEAHSKFVLHRSLEQAKQLATRPNEFCEGCKQG